MYRAFPAKGDAVQQKISQRGSVLYGVETIISAILDQHRKILFHGFHVYYGVFFNHHHVAVVVGAVADGIRFGHPLHRLKADGVAGC